MSESLKRPYVGVSGVVSPDVQKTLEGIATREGLFDTNRMLALGVKAVHKTQYLDIENKYGADWYPVGEEAFTGALRHDNSNPNTIAVAQAYLDPEHIDSKAYREAFLRRISNRGKAWLQAIQFDMLPWHEDLKLLDFLATVKAEGLVVLLQAHKDAMEDLGPTGIVQRLGRYAHLVDYLLFDSSHGTGTRLNTHKLTPFVAEAHAGLDLSQTGIAIAGGLDAIAVYEDLPELLAKYPNLSWDAEGRLHPLNTEGRRPLDLDVAEMYLRASSEILTHHVKD